MAPETKTDFVREWGFLNDPDGQIWLITRVSRPGQLGESAWLKAAALQSDSWVQVLSSALLGTQDPDLTKVALIDDTYESHGD
jgi:hypothetical protein